MQRKSDLEKENDTSDGTCGDERAHDADPTEAQQPGQRRPKREPIAFARMTKHQYSNLCALWRSGVDATCQALSMRSEALKSDVPLGGHAGKDDNELSLLLSHHQGSDHEVRILLVYWTNSIRRIGKAVSLDEQMRVVNIPNFVKSHEDFSKAEIVLPAVGAHMRKAKADREQVPQDALRLKGMFEAAFTPLTGMTQITCLESESCFICERESHEDTAAGANVKEKASNDGGQADMVCVFCLLASHRSCCEQLLHHWREADNDMRHKHLGFRRRKFNLNMIPSSLFGEISP